ncbi:MAG: hypothetical protein ACQEQ4_04450 [Fibrobacterota bacterium]
MESSKKPITNIIKVPAMIGTETGCDSIESRMETVEIFDNPQKNKRLIKKEIIKENPPILGIIS